MLGLGHLLAGLANVADTDVVLEELEPDLANVLAAAAERFDGGDGAVVQPVEVRRVLVRGRARVGARVGLGLGLGSGLGLGLGLG